MGATSMPGSAERAFLLSLSGASDAQSHQGLQSNPAHRKQNLSFDWLTGNSGGGFPPSRGDGYHKRRTASIGFASFIGSPASARPRPTRRKAASLRYTRLAQHPPPCENIGAVRCGCASACCVDVSGLASRPLSTGRGRCGHTRPPHPDPLPPGEDIGAETASQKVIHPSAAVRLTRRAAVFDSGSHDYSMGPLCARVRANLSLGSTR